MKHLISFEEERIVYVKGKNKGNRLLAMEVHIEPTPGAILNGHVKDKEALARGLKKLAAASNLRDKRVTVVLPGQTIASRELSLPPAQSEKEMRRMVNNEMLYRHSGMDSDYVIDYMAETSRLGETNEKGGSNVLAFAIQTSCLEDYLGLLEDAGLRCRCMDVVPNCVGKLFHRSYPEFESALVTFVTPATITFLLMDHDVCVFSQSVRLTISQFEQTNSLDFLAEEISGHLDKMLSFHSTRKDSLPVQKILLMGYKPQLEQLLPLLGNDHEIKCEIFDAKRITDGPPTGEPFSDYVAPLGALIRRKK